tara:strand:+ start:295 stop:1284 length:990 start_codon:yes stop_codon:yes gene_type:complete
MFKRLDPQDVDKTPFKVYKEFTVTNNDSGSGVYNFRAISGSHHNYISSSADVKHYPSASFYSLPSYFMINSRYYRQTKSGVRRTVVNPYNNFASNNPNQYRVLHQSASVISVSKNLYGERMKPGSIRLEDDSTNNTVVIVDDAKGNLYDVNVSSSFAKFASQSFTVSDHTESFAGNVFYEEGVLVITNTGSKFIDVGTKVGTDGYSLEYKSQITLNEYSYTCVVGENEFNSSTNISTTFQRSGSVNVDGVDSWRFFPPGDAKFKSGSYKQKYEQATRYAAFTTHSEFQPYVTKIGLYNDFDELIAIGQLSAPIKNEKDLALGFVVRFDA